jgi:sugar O-acyltransferase (sialic acid O-acetyltransferase NeuD family)
MKDIIIYGAGSVGRLAEQIIVDINQVSDQFNLLGFLDDDKSKHRTLQHGTPILGDIQWLIQRPNTSVVIGFSNPKQKKQLHTRLKEFGHKHFATLIHPDTWIANRVDVGVGSVIYPGVHLDVDIRLGDFCLLNKLSTVGHDTSLGDYTTVSPGVNIGGYNNIGKGVEFGINSCSIQHLRIGNWSVIGAGAVIIRDVPAGSVMVGNPGRELKKTAR